MIPVAGGVRLYFEQLGSGTQTVLVPNGLYLREDFHRFTDGRTLIFYDVRNRGRSDPAADPTLLARGIEQDVDDLEAVRRHFGVDQVDVIGHSYVGVLAALYAMRYPAHTRRVVQIGPVYPVTKEYPPHLKYTDEIMSSVMAEMGRMAHEPAPADPEQACRKFWSLVRAIYVVDPANAHRIEWGRCELANERSFMQYWLRYLLPSIQSLNLTAEEFAKATAPVLIVHGIQDRNAPYGGARDWAAQLPNARLVAVENAAHAPWIEAPELVFDSIKSFLDGVWPKAAEEVKT